MHWAAQLSVAAAAVFVVWLLLRPRFDFVVALTRDGPRMKKGKITAGQLAEIASVCGEFQITRGWIGVVRQKKSARLSFSRNLPPEFCQRVRNLWQLH